MKRTLSARLGEAEGKITEAKNITVDAKGKIEGKIGLKLNVNGKVVGYESTINGEYNEFAINADNFKISNGANNYTPFRIDTGTGTIEFLGKVSFNSLTNKPNIPTQSDIQNTANSAINSAKSSIISDAKTQAKSELASSIADAKKAGTDAQSLATQAKNNADSANTKATQAQSQAQQALNSAKTDSQIQNIVRNTTEIDGGHLKTGTVDAIKMKVAKLSAISANMGEITAGSLNINNKAKIATDGTLTATGANINGTITATGGSITGDLYVGDRNGGYVLISGSQKAIIVYEGTVPKVRLGKLN